MISAEGRWADTWIESNATPAATAAFLTKARYAAARFSQSRL
jgi:hypothetical protein